MPTVLQYVTTLKQEIYDYVDNPSSGATVRDKDSVQTLHHLAKKLKALPHPHLVVVCDFRHLEHLLGAMLMKSGDLVGRLDMWNDVFLDPSPQAADVAKKMAAKPPGTYFIFPEPIARKLGFAQRLLQTGIHQMPLEFQGRDGEDDIETLKLDGADATSVLQEIQAPQKREEPHQEVNKDKCRGVSFPVFTFCVGVSYLAGGLTLYYLLKAFG